MWSSEYLHTNTVHYIKTFEIRNAGTLNDHHLVKGELFMTDFCIVIS